jgi:hypothetical protein
MNLRKGTTFAQLRIIIRKSWREPLEPSKRFSRDTGLTTNLIESLVKNHLRGSRSKILVEQFSSTKKGEL